MPICRLSCVIYCHQNDWARGGLDSLSLEIPASLILWGKWSAARLHHVNLPADDSTQPGTVAAADTLGVINLYVSRVRSSIAVDQVARPHHFISRQAVQVYDCNWLVWAVGPWVCSCGRISVLINWSSSDVSRGANAVEDALLLPCGMQCSGDCLCQRSAGTA